MSGESDHFWWLWDRYTPEQRNAVLDPDRARMLRDVAELLRGLAR